MMITIYKNTPPGLALFTEPIEGSWINVVNPDSDEISRLTQIGFTADYVTYPLDMDERPRTERENGELFILLRIPYYQGETSDIPYTTIPLAIVITNQHIVTVCKCENGLLSEFTSGRMKDLSTGKHNRFVLRLLFREQEGQLGTGQTGPDDQQIMYVRILSCHRTLSHGT